MSIAPVVVQIFLFLVAGAVILLSLYLYITNWFTRPAQSAPLHLLRAKHKPLPGKVLALLGDSITLGRISASYEQILTPQLQNNGITIANGGINAALTHTWLERLEEVYPLQPTYVLILLGTNDAIGTWDPIAGQKAAIEQGAPQPPSLPFYRFCLTEILLRLRQHTRAHLAVMSIPPIGEDPSHPAYAISAAFAAIAHEVAMSHNVTYLPLFEQMDAALRNSPPANPPPIESWRALMNRQGLQIFLWRTSPDDLSRRAGLLLHTDHIHLNTRAAEMIAALIQTWLLSCCD